MGLDIDFFAKDRHAEAENQKVEEIGYFRKLNALFNWVNTHIGLIENCVEIPVSKTHLAQLYVDLCRLTPQNCAEVFPTQSGYFFGPTEYDEYYGLMVAALKKWVVEQLQVFDFKNKQFLFGMSCIYHRYRLSLLY